MGLVAVQFIHTSASTTSRAAAWTLVPFLLGLALFGAGAGSALRRRWWRAHATSALGRIVDHVSNPGRHRVAAPVIEFDAGGRRITFCASAHRSDPYLPVGEATGVLYDPTDPRRATLADTDPGFSWVMLAGLVILGLFMAVVVG